MKTHQTDFSQGSIYRNIMEVAVPMTVAQLLNLLYNIVDRMYIGRIMGSDKDPFYGAPVVLIVLAKKEAPTHVYDGSLVMGNLMLAAHALDIGSCWIHRAKEEFESAEGQEILKDLGIEGEYEGIGHCVLGYVDGEYPATHPRKDNWVYYVK